MTGAKRDAGGISCLLDGGPQDLPRTKAKAVSLALIAVDVHQPDEVDLTVIGNRKRTSKAPTVDPRVLFFMSHLSPALPVSQEVGVR
jgi:hypothetical protein